MNFPEQQSLLQFRLFQPLKHLKDFFGLVLSFYLEAESIAIIIASRFFGMNSFKSSPLIQDRVKPRFTRKSRRVSKKRRSRELQQLIANPFHQGNQQNFLPSDLKSQIQHMDYISPSQIQTITFTTAAGARRSSTLARHLQAMQNAAKKQTQMYQFFIGEKAEKKESCETQVMQEEKPITIEQNDNMSTKMNQCFFLMDTDDIDQQPINFFSQDEQSEEIIFYSQNILQSQDLGEDYQAYFDV